MSVIGSNILAGASGQGGGYNLTRSLRFRSSASAYLNRTPTSAGNRQIFTFSSWIKRGELGGTNKPLFSANPVASEWSVIRFNNDNISVGYDNSSIGFCFFTTTAVYRDPSSWYHVVVAVDTTQATATNRIKIYVNGVQQTTTQAFASQIIPQNFQFGFNNNVAHRISSLNDGGGNFFLDAYQTEVNFIDGQALTPSSFGEYSATTGVWQPKKYAGTYGTNGFYLPFTNNSTTTTLGNDFSGNGNNWTTNNISLTAGATYDSMTDVPTLTSATASNFAVLNPLDKSSAVSVSNGNLVATNTNTSERRIRGTMQIPSNGKWYFEVIPSGSSQGYFGIASASAPLDSTGAQSYGWNENGRFYVNGSFSTTPFPTWTSGDVLAIAIDTTANTILFYKNGVAVSAGAQSIDGSYSYFPFFLCYNITWTANFGQRPFAFSPPTGFVALNTFNLPTPTIGATASSQANKYFDINLWTGNDTTQTITNSGGFQPDWVWIKQRTSTNFHQLVDAVRGNTKYLYSNSTEAEETISTRVTSFNSNGVTLGSSQAVNNLGSSFVGWQWKANGTGVSNTAGSITSTVSANTSAGFSVVTYTLNNTTFTVGHGLGVAPRMIIVKNLDTTNNWDVYHASIGAGNRLQLNSTAASQSSTQVWNNTAPTSTVFSGDSAWWSNPSTSRMVAYCFAPVAGYSAFGSYTGNGSTDGTFVYTGFTPRFIMLKRTDATGAWYIYDTARDTFNVANKRLVPSDSVAESSDINTLDILSNGFKLRDTTAVWNASGGSYIYMAFASNPFKYSLAR